MFFITSFDDHEYFMIGGWGCCQCQHHIKLNCNQIQTRTCHLSASAAEIITDIAMAQAKNAIGANIFMLDLGKSSADLKLDI